MINLVKILLTYWEIEEKNRKIVGGWFLIDEEKLKNLQNPKMILNIYLIQSLQNW